MHKDRDSNNSARKEAGWAGVEKEELNSALSLQEKAGPQRPVMISPFVWGYFSNKFCPRMVEIHGTFLFFLSGKSKDVSGWEGALRGA